VWVGANYDPEKDLAYSAYIKDQIERSGLVDKFMFIDEFVDLSLVFNESKLFLLTPRLDPLPNVAIDSLFAGVPVMCLDESTGIAQILKDSGLGDACVANYFDTKELANKAVMLLENESKLLDVKERSKELASDIFNMKTYVAKLIDFMVES
jgi:glycosyltransferase involved in cell wall biosynthesis